MTASARETQEEETTMDFTRYYHTRTKDSIDEDRAKIQAGFYDLIKRGAQPRLRLSTYYKGLPISYPATMTDYGFGVLSLDVHQQQAVALEHVQRAFISCEYFDCAILSEVANVDVRRTTAQLKNFRFVDVMAERRESLRLDLDPRTPAEIIGCGKFEGELSDLSLGGCSIRTDSHSELDRDRDFRLRLKIPNLLQNNLQSVEVSARFVKCTSESDYDTCSFAFDLEGHEESIISRYTFQRQVEIVRELKEAT